MRDTPSSSSAYITPHQLALSLPSLPLALSLPSAYIASELQAFQIIYGTLGFCKSSNSSHRLHFYRFSSAFDRVTLSIYSY